MNQFPSVPVYQYATLHITDVILAGTGRSKPFSGIRERRGNEKMSIKRIIFYTTTMGKSEARMRGSHFAKRALSVNLMLSKMWLRRPLSKV